MLCNPPPLVRRPPLTGMAGQSTTTFVGGGRGRFDDDDDAPSPPSSSSSSSSWSPSLVAFVSGGVGGACSVLIGHPLDLVKVRMQTTTSTTTTTTTNATSVRGMLIDTMRSGGIFGSNGIFRGLVPPLLMVIPTTAVAFWGYDVGRRLVLHYDRETGDDEEEGMGVVRRRRRRRRGMGDEGIAMGGTEDAIATNATTTSPPQCPRSLTTSEVCIAGAISAVPTTLIVAPTERIKCLLQVQPHDGANTTFGVEKRRRYYSGTFDCITRVYNEGGIRSLYRGTGMTFVRGVPGTMAYFAAYEYAKDGITSLQRRRDGITDASQRQPSALAILIAGGFAGMAYWAVGIPIIADV
jgi:solute carrier family 25 carnitine/acylcarnitine transporter 20/29